MEPNAIESQILTALRGLGHSFAQDELAYLALTSKVEGPVRDKLAFALHTALGTTNLVAREWDRVDLALLTPEQEPVVLIELKAMYSFDDAVRYCRITAADEVKTRAFAPTANAVYSLLLATHVGASVPSYLRRIVKYDDGINRILRQLGSADLVRESMLERMNAALGGRRLVGSGNIAGGSVHSLPVDVFYWLVRDAGHMPAALAL